MTYQQKIARRVAFRFLREMKYLKQTGIAHNVIIELWLRELITFNTKNILIKWLYMCEVQYGRKRQVREHINSIKRLLQ